MVGWGSSSAVASCSWNILGGGPAGGGMWSWRSWTGGRPAPCSWSRGWAAGRPGSATPSPIRWYGCRPASVRSGPPSRLSWVPRRRGKPWPVTRRLTPGPGSIPTGARGRQSGDGGRSRDRPARRGATAGIPEPRLAHATADRTCVRYLHIRAAADLTLLTLIRESAMRLTAERGWAAVAIWDIAADVGVSSSLVVHRFGTKARLRELDARGPEWCICDAMFTAFIGASIVRCSSGADLPGGVDDWSVRHEWKGRCDECRGLQGCCHRPRGGSSAGRVGRFGPGRCDHGVGVVSQGRSHWPGAGRGSTGVVAPIRGPAADRPSGCAATSAGRRQS